MFGRLVQKFITGGGGRKGVAVPHERYRHRPRVGVFEERLLLTTYTWVGTTPNWTTGTNWSPAAPMNMPGDQDTVIFGAQHDQPCSIPGTVHVLNAQMQNGYDKTITLAAGVTWESTNGFTFNPANAHISFSNAACELLADGGGSNLSNFTFSGAVGTVMIRNGASLAVATTGPATSSSTADWSIFGTLTVNNAAELDFSNHGITVFSGGQMSLGNKDGVVQISDGGGTAAITINSGANFLFTGTAGTTSKLAIPMLMKGTATFSGGTLYFQHANATTGSYGYEMDSGTTKLEGGVNLESQAGYYQTGGTLNTDMNVTKLTLMGATPKAEIDGGVVSLGTLSGLSSFGTLNVLNGNLNFNGGEFDAKINGGSTQCDQLTVDAVHTVSVGGASKLVVTMVGPLTLAKGNVWKLLAGSGADTAAWGTPPTLPTGVQVKNPQQVGFYELTPS